MCLCTFILCDTLLIFNLKYVNPKESSRFWQSDLHQFGNLCAQCLFIFSVRAILCFAQFHVLVQNDLQCSVGKTMSNTW